MDTNISNETQDALEMLGAGYENVRVKDESSDRKYFTITPRIVKALSRNAHDFAVWDTIKDIAGENGECILNTEQIAILSGVSTGQVSKSRRYWLKLGFLKGEMRRDPGFTQSVWHLTVPDIWRKNVEWCEKYPKIADRLAFRQAHKSLHTVKASPSETKKNNPLKNAFQIYEENIGPLTPIIADALNDDIKTYTEDWVKDAIQESAVSNKRGLKYIEAILKGRKERGGSTEKKPVQPLPAPPRDPERKLVTTEMMRRHGRA